MTQIKNNFVSNKQFAIVGGKPLETVEKVLEGAERRTSMQRYKFSFDCSALLLFKEERQRGGKYLFW